MCTQHVFIEHRITHTRGGNNSTAGAGAGARLTHAGAALARHGGRRRRLGMGRAKGSLVVVVQAGGALARLGHFPVPAPRGGARGGGGRGRGLEGGIEGKERGGREVHLGWCEFCH